MITGIGQQAPVNRLAELTRAFGGPVSTALLDPRCKIFSTRGIEGVIGYRVGWGCAVAIGEPVCAPSDMRSLVDAFERTCRERGWRVCWAVVGPRFARDAAARGYASIEFGEELILDPRQNQQKGTRGHELRKKIHRAQRAGVQVAEYRGQRAPDPPLEHAMDQVAISWLRQRRGPQIYLSHIRLFDERIGRRWFYAREGERMVGVLTLVELWARGGWLLEHLLATPDSPQGVTELLITAALSALGAEGYAFASFGPAPAPALGRITGIGRAPAAAARHIFRAASRIFHLEAHMRYRRKFLIARTEPSYLLFGPAGLSVREVVGLFRAFNVSLG